MTFTDLPSALGAAVLQSTWQGALIGLGTMSALELTRRSGARIRHAICVAAMSLLLILFVATFVWNLSPHLSVAGLDPTAVTPPPSVPTDGIGTLPVVSIDSNGRSPMTPSLISVLGWTWLAGCVVMAIRLVRQAFTAQRLRRSGTIPPPSVWQRTFEELKKDLGIGRGTRMMVSRMVDSPMVVGWFKPIVLVPVSTFTSLNPEQIRALLIHELTHLSRGDHLLNMFQGLVEVVLFFHPVTWWISHRIRSEREDSCDDRVIEITGSPRRLAEALLVLETLRSFDSPSTTTINAHGGRLMHRIHRLFDRDLAAPRRGNWRMASACIFASIVGGVLLLSSASTAQAQDRAIEDRTTEESRTPPTRERRRPDGDTEVDRERESIDLEELKAGIERRIKAMDERLGAMVEAGEISEADAKARYEEGERRMWDRYRAAEERMAGGDERRESPELMELKARIEERLEALGIELREAVAAGKTTAEDARAKFAEAEEQMWRRYRAAEERMAGGDERRESSELMELKARIEERLKALGLELQEAVAAGTMTAEDAKVKFAEAEERMWDRYRAAEERMAAAGERGESPELAELKAGIEERLQVLGLELRQAVTDGTMTAEEARAKFAEAEERMWRRYRMAEEKAAEGDQPRSPELMELKAGIEARLEALGIELREAVADGEMTADVARARFEEAEKRMWERYRSAEADQRKNLDSKKDGSKARDEGEGRKTPPERIQTRLDRLQTLFEQGKITRKQMEQRKNRLKERMKD